MTDIPWSSLISKEVTAASYTDLVSPQENGTNCSSDQLAPSKVRVRRNRKWVKDWWVPLSAFILPLLFSDKVCFQPGTLQPRMRHTSRPPSPDFRSMTQCWSHLGKTAPRKLTESGGASFCPSVFCPHFACDGWRLRSCGESHGNLKDWRCALGWWSRKAEARGPSDVNEALASPGLLVSSLFYLRKTNCYKAILALFVFKPQAVESNS